MSAGEMVVDAERQKRARAFLAGLVERFEIETDDGAAATPIDPEAAALAKAKKQYDEALVFAKLRAGKAAEVAGEGLAAERVEELAAKKRQLAAHVGAARTIADKIPGAAARSAADRIDGYDAARGELDKANVLATEILSRRYQLDKQGRQKEAKTTSPEYAAGDTRSFRGKEIRGTYKQEDRSKYEDAAKQRQSADYIGPDGRLRDFDGNLVDAAGSQATYTSRLDTGTSHRFNAADQHHSYATEGTAVVGAGTRVVEKGIVRTITGDSGHYTPSATNIHEYVEALMEQGVKMIDDVTLFMPNPAKPSEHVPVADDGLKADWQAVVEYEKARSGRQASGGAAEPYDPEVLAKKQRLADREIWPGRKDAVVSAVPEGYLVDATEWGSGPAGDDDAAKAEHARKLTAMLQKRLGKAIFIRLPNLPVKPAPLTPSNIPKIFNILPHTEKNKKNSIFEMTADDVNHFLGMMLRLEWDKPSADAKGSARMELDAQRFVQTGGNADAAKQKAALNEWIGPEADRKAAEAIAHIQGLLDSGTLPAAGAERARADIAKLQAALDHPDYLADVESAARPAELYEQLGGDAALAAKLGVYAPEDIADVDLKSAWLVKGRITDDRALDQLLIDRHGIAKDDVWMLGRVSIAVKTEMLQAAPGLSPDVLRLAVAMENYRLSDFEQFPYDHVRFADWLAVAKLLGIDVDDLKKFENTAPSGLTYGVLAESLRIAPEELYERLGGTVPRPAEAEAAEAETSEDGGESALRGPAEAEPTAVVDDVDLREEFADGGLRGPNLYAGDAAPHDVLDTDDVKGLVDAVAAAEPEREADPRTEEDDALRYAKSFGGDDIDALREADAYAGHVSADDDALSDDEVDDDREDEDSDDEDDEAAEASEEDRYVRSLQTPPAAPPETPSRPASAGEAAEVAPQAAPQGAQPGLEKIDLRRVKKGTKADPQVKQYEELGGDRGLLDQLLELWTTNNAASLDELKALQAERDQLHKNWSGSPDELKTALKTLDGRQRTRRDELKTIVDGGRPSLGDLATGKIDTATKIELLRKPQLQAEFLAKLAGR